MGTIGKHRQPAAKHYRAHDRSMHIYIYIYMYTHTLKDGFVSYLAVYKLKHAVVEHFTDYVFDFVKCRVGVNIKKWEYMSCCQVLHRPKMCLCVVLHFCSRWLCIVLCCVCTCLHVHT